MSCRVEVLARDGRGGGAVPLIMVEGPLLLAAKGSWSIGAFGEPEGRLCFREGWGFTSELRTRGGVEVPLEEGGLEVGGGGACRKGTNGSW